MKFATPNQYECFLIWGLQLNRSHPNNRTVPLFLEDKMNLSTPKNITFYIAVILAVVGLIGYFVASMEAFAPWLMLVAFVVLAAGNLFEGL